MIPFDWETLAKFIVFVFLATAIFYFALTTYERIQRMRQWRRDREWRRLQGWDMPTEREESDSDEPRRSVMNGV